MLVLSVIVVLNIICLFISQQRTSLENLTSLHAHLTTTHDTTQQALDTANQVRDQLLEKLV